MILINGEHATHIDATDRGLQYGDGIFETIEVKGSRLLLWDYHKQRLDEGCARLSIEHINNELLYKEAQQLCVASERAVLKIIVTRGSSGRGYRVTETSTPTRIVMLCPWPDYPPDYAGQGVAIRLCTTGLACNPTLTGIKHLNRLEQVLARNEWEDPTYFEGLMLDANGDVIEGIISNVFIVRDGILLTPDLSKCGVAGVMRRLIIELAKQYAVPLSITRLSPADVKTADEVFISNSLIRVCPVNRFDDISYSVGPVTQAIADRVNNYIEHDKKVL